jgi:malonate decarboxylase epsilon subunit
MSVAFLFPGQGSQAPGMLHSLPNYASVAGTLAEVSESLEENVLELDSPQALRSTLSVQLALLASGVAVARALVAEGVQPEAVAGMSAGAFAAAVIAGVLNLADAVRLVKQRADGMVNLYPKGYGLAAIVGLTEKQVFTLVEEAYTVQSPVYVGNINAPRQIVIAGSNEGINRVLKGARKSGARKAVPLDVSEPSHCPLLEPVAATFNKELAVNTSAKPEIDLRRQRYRTSVAKCGSYLGGPGNQHCAWRSLARRDNGPDGIGLSPISRDASGPCSK